MQRMLCRGGGCAEGVRRRVCRGGCADGEGVQTGRVCRRGGCAEEEVGKKESDNT